MSIYSYTTYTCSFPTEEADAERLAEVYGTVREVGNFRTEIQFDGETTYSDDILCDLVPVFGKPLDEVPGLKLELHYETTDVDEGFFGFDLTIDDGKATYRESCIEYRERPMSECPTALDYGLPIHSAREAYRQLLWHADEWDEGERRFVLTDTLRSELRHYVSGLDEDYPEGTPVETVLKAIEDKFGIARDRFIA